ncbi:hypothetical protein CFOL_v3_30496, partial [Cephalotus follicularis]
RDKPRLTQFLIALRDDFEPIRASILNRQPLPSLETALLELISKETRCLSITSQQSPFIITATSSTPPQRSDNSKRPCCIHCHRIGHTMKTCYDIVGRPLVNLLVSRVLLQLLQLHPVLSLLLIFISFLLLTLRLYLIRLCHVLVLLPCLPL